MESIVCNGIGKIYGKKQVLKNINLTLEKGKIYGLIGRNGAGKTDIVIHYVRTESGIRRNCDMEW